MILCRPVFVCVDAVSVLPQNITVRVFPCRAVFLLLGYPFDGLIKDADLSCVLTALLQDFNGFFISVLFNIYFFRQVNVCLLTLRIQIDQLFILDLSRFKITLCYVLLRELQLLAVRGCFTRRKQNYAKNRRDHYDARDYCGHYFLTLRNPPYAVSVHHFLFPSDSSTDLLQVLLRMPCSPLSAPHDLN